MGGCHPPRGVGSDILLQRPPDGYTSAVRLPKGRNVRTIDDVEDDSRALRIHLDLARAERTREQEEAARREAAIQEQRFEELLRRVHAS